MPKQPSLPETEYELEIVLMSGDITAIRRRLKSMQDAKDTGSYYHINGLWIAGGGGELVFVPGHRIRKMAIREKKPLSL